MGYPSHLIYRMHLVEYEMAEEFKYIIYNLMEDKSVVTLDKVFQRCLEKYCNL